MNSEREIDTFAESIQSLPQRTVAETPSSLAQKFCGTVARFASDQPRSMIITRGILSGITGSGTRVTLEVPLG